jgi:integrase
VPKVAEEVRRTLEACTGEPVNNLSEAQAAWLRLQQQLSNLSEEEADLAAGRAAIAALSGRAGPDVIRHEGGKAAAPATVGGMVDKWLRLESQRRSVGQLGGGRADSNRVCVCHFRDWIGKDAPVTDVNGGKWQDWYSFLAGKRASGEWSEAHVDRILQVAKRFVKALWEWELIGLPRNLDSKTLSFQVSPKQIEVFSADELAALWGAVKNQSRLHVLLCLNCGMLAKDVNDLRHDEVDWSAGVVTRKRSKTAEHEEVPVVRYKLWARTFELLKEYRSKDGDVVLLTESGKRWIQEKEEGGRWSRSDSVRSCLRNYMVKAKIDRPVKALRATAASKLAEHKDYKFYVQYFLGHSPRTVADKHYVVPSRREFDEAVAWLETALGI